jgi:hypothetical protein
MEVDDDGWSSYEPRYDYFLKLEDYFSLKLFFTVVPRSEKLTKMRAIWVSNDCDFAHSML